MLQLPRFDYMAGHLVHLAHDVELQEDSAGNPFVRLPDSKSDTRAGNLESVSYPFSHTSFRTKPSIRSLRRFTL